MIGTDSAITYALPFLGIALLNTLKDFLQSNGLGWWRMRLALSSPTRDSNLCSPHLKAGAKVWFGERRSFFTAAISESRKPVYDEHRAALGSGQC